MMDLFFVKSIFLLTHAVLCLKESQPRSGLLQSSLVTLYTMYLTWSAMTNEPGKIIFPLHRELLCFPTAHFHQSLCCSGVRQNMYNKPHKKSTVHHFTHIYTWMVKASVWRATVLSIHDMVMLTQITHTHMLVIVMYLVNDAHVLCCLCTDASSTSTNFDSCESQTGNVTQAFWVLSG